MHPADQFEAFVALIAEGRPIEDIAADFGVTPLVVQRRLKLANISPRLMADYRADTVNLDQLTALAITDDHAAQEAAFYDAPDWQRSPSVLRERLTEREIDAHQHPLVRFVGLAIYEAAPPSVLNEGLFRGRRLPQSAQPERRLRFPIFLFHAVLLHCESAASLSGYAHSRQGGEVRALTVQPYRPIVRLSTG